jgi:hypothetical protein
MVADRSAVRLVFFGSFSGPLLPGMLISERISLIEASAMMLRRYVD